MLSRTTLSLLNGMPMSLCNLHTILLVVIQSRARSNFDCQSVVPCLLLCDYTCLLEQVCGFSPQWGHVCTLHSLAYQHMYCRLTFKEGISSLARLSQTHYLNRSPLPTYACSLWVTRPTDMWAALPFEAMDPDCQCWEGSALHNLLDQHRLLISHCGAAKFSKVAPAARMHMQMNLFLQALQVEAQPCQPPPHLA